MHFILSLSRMHMRANLVVIVDISNTQWNNLLPRLHPDDFSLDMRSALDFQVLG